jgi:hypothetical protein
MYSYISFFLKFSHVMFLSFFQTLFFIYWCHSDCISFSLILFPVIFLSFVPFFIPHPWVTYILCSLSSELTVHLNVKFLITFYWGIYCIAFQTLPADFAFSALSATLSLQTGRENRSQGVLEMSILTSLVWQKWTNLKCMYQGMEKFINCSQYLSYCQQNIASVKIKF